MSPKWLPPEQYIETIAKATSGASFYFTDTAGRPVQLRSSLKPDIWQFPGGNMDPGETPWECAVRECREETGIVFEGEKKLLGVQFIGHHERTLPLNNFVVVFDGGTLADEQIENIVLDPDEHTEVRVRTVEQWEKEMTPLSFTRLREIDNARRMGTVAYLEH